MKGLVSFFVGLTFAIGLGISGMTRPDIVQGFLDVFGAWDPRLMGVMVGAIGLHLFTYKLITKKSSPIYDSIFHLPSKENLDGKLVIGAVIFGLGWGWAGICPGPGIVGIASGKSAFIIFVISMIVGMKAHQIFARRVLHEK